jgi:hypothetical protein
MDSRHIFIAFALTLLAGTSIAQVADVQDAGAQPASTSQGQQEKRGMREQEREARRAHREERKQMTQEERQQLRSDVDHANREIYRKPHKSKPQSKSVEAP